VSDFYFNCLYCILLSFQVLSSSARQVLHYAILWCMLDSMFFGSFAKLDGDVKSSFSTYLLYIICRTYNKCTCIRSMSTGS
jgi:hypothetical protein